MGRLQPRFKSHAPGRARRSPGELYDAALRHFVSRRYRRLLEAVRSACEAHRKPARFGYAIDLGCGTGLAAAAFAEMVDAFTGIDLSPHMIEKARATGRYARLEVTDMLDALRSMPDRGVELVLAADAMVLSPICFRF
jgi:predicted TPR repeat methyltransferase